MTHDPIADPLPPHLRVRVNAAAEQVISDMFRTPTRREQHEPLPEISPKKTAAKPGRKPRPKAKEPKPLSYRERRVAALSPKMTGADIAERLGVHRNTVYEIQGRLRARGALK